MKTLVELLHDEMVRNGYFGVNGRDDEALAGIVGSVQEWLGQSEIGDLIERAAATSAGERALLAEAGRGLDVAAP